MDDSKLLIEKIVEGIQDRKGEKITIVDMSELDNSVCSYFVVCQGQSNTHVSSIADSVYDYVLKQIRTKPFAFEGQENSFWVAIDYGDVIVHVFQPEYRSFYCLESLWADAKLTEIPDLQ